MLPFTVIVFGVPELSTKRLDWQVSREVLASEVSGEVGTVMLVLLAP